MGLQSWVPLLGHLPLSCPTHQTILVLRSTCLNPCLPLLARRPAAVLSVAIPTFQQWTGSESPLACALFCQLQGGAAGSCGMVLSLSCGMVLSLLHHLWHTAQTLMNLPCRPPLPPAPLHPSNQSTQSCSVSWFERFCFVSSHLHAAAYLCGGGLARALAQHI